MLRNVFYKTLSSEKLEDGSFKSTLLLDKDHAIFDGHFPNFPVVPGVCMMQIVKEQIENNSNRKLQLVSAGNIKFLSLINPIETAEIDVIVKYAETTDSSLTAEGTIFVNNQAFFKILKTIYK